MSIILSLVQMVLAVNGTFFKFVVLQCNSAQTVGEKKLLSCLLVTNMVKKCKCIHDPEFTKVLLLLS